MRDQNIQATTIISENIKMPEPVQWQSHRILINFFLQCLDSGMSLTLGCFNDQVLLCRIELVLVYQSLMGRLTCEWSSVLHWTLVTLRTVEWGTVNSFNIIIWWCFNSRSYHTRGQGTGDSSHARGGGVVSYANMRAYLISRGAN